jgi:hypothetical protein
MKIMAKQATQTGLALSAYLIVNVHKLEGRLWMLFRVHFPESSVTEDSIDGQRQQNLDVCRTNKGQCNLARNLVHESEIKWVLGNSKPFESGGQIKLLPHFCGRAWSI